MDQQVKRAPQERTYYEVVSVRLPVSLSERLRHDAAQARMSRSRLIRRMVEQQLATADAAR